VNLPAQRLAVIAALAAIILHITLGVLLIPHIGPQYDEALFALGILPPVYVESSSHRNPAVAFMLMPYIGALKIWLYKPIFALAAPGLWSMRLPVLLMCALSVWLTFLIARRFLPAPFAAFSALLLAADPIFLLTGTFDWGPVALQHLLALLMVWATLRANETADWRWAAAAGFACGLGIWDKVSFLWILGGLLAATLLLARAPALRLCRNPRLAAAALAGAALGAAVFLRYNIRSDFATFRATAGLDFSALYPKLQMLMFTLEGSAMFGFLVNDSGQAAGPQWSLQAYALFATLLAIPLLGALRRLALFLATALAAIWVLMAVMRNAGQSSHHTILVWPLPQLLIAIAAAGLAERGRLARAALAFSGIALLGSSLAVCERYIRLARTEGPGPQWSLASGTLAGRLLELKPKSVFVVDWGILSQLRLLGAGRIPLLPASDFVVRDSRARPEDARLLALKDPATLAVTHPDELLIFPGSNAMLDEWASTRGLTKEPVDFIRDRHGVIRYLIFRYRSSEQPAPPAPPR
jgi:4-amino-4-deoxy-L-arabinose transferase-like glycosyltransferase